MDNHASTLPIRQNFRNPVPGLLLIAVIAFLADWVHGLITIGGQHPVSSVIIAIVFGMTLKASNMISPAFRAGISYSVKKVLKLAIILLGLSLSLKAIASTGVNALLLILISVTMAILLTAYVSKKMGLPSRLGILIGVGTAICGTSAIVAAAPAIDAEESDVSYAVATITLFGIIAIFAYPFLGHLFQLTNVQFGTWAGIAINETAQVVAAGFIYSDEAGKIATVVKLTRTVLIAPLVLLLGIIYTRNGLDRSNGKIDYIKIFPWFVVGFVFLSVLRTTGDATFMIPRQLAVWKSFLGHAQKVAMFMIYMAMAGVGMNTDFRQIRRVGLKPFLAGLLAATIMGSIGLLLILKTGLA